ncbi:cysteine dioxygenase family protein [Catenulispora subtropica]|uniref:Cysteine dioxygenase family protein n=1 Tax=Catenulispora subtropica TaxID=450798 RepID=A0ABN2SZH3_9ACTN
MSAPATLPPELDLAAPFLSDLVQPDRPLWTPSQLRELTRTLARDHADALRPLVRHTEPQRWWTRLALTRGVEVWLLSWLPGQGTQPHDHGGAAGAFAVLTGEVLEEHRYPGAAIGTRRLGTGQALGFGGDRAHVVRNVGIRPAATVHAYSPPLLPTREYASLEEVV